ncbi:MULTISPECIES: enoyl-CoA hydratase/isomerase family protein [unclassified Microbacterium]|uniref:enoyl-CoA hydratase/isomerase family protein n=1 Tax=unclassified Microbacterium TaxID=2609290 RepID=UPI00214B5518|nr:MULTISPECIES: enoyl-CoA hydratase-related protein [unclassified Microbacterium]MCR2800400.1 enoyl-CoA hydratase-related protein [Microbacterium sp. zg.Y818]MCR2826222.1 enoyl-CoA hydratase-related protein [Microbacterium sp. zg.Y909]WIM22360.1 enoyl-CoA hydratase-related protein [Microbacterium sp. zg-Y818]
MTVHLTVDEGVAWVTLDRPEALNALDAPTRAELRTIYRRISDDSEIRVAVLTGAGDRSFSTGADLKSAPASADSLVVQEFGGRSDHLLADFPVDKPTICAINGYALGGGLEIALRADIRIASANASFGLPEARIGSIPGSAGTQLLPRVVGVPNAMKMILTGERIDAEEALRIGLVQEVVPFERLQERASELARAIAGNAPLAISAVKKLVTMSQEVPLEAGIAAERYAFGLLRDTEDRAEGRRAFAEKRTPRFVGR